MNGKSLNNQMKIRSIEICWAFFDKINCEEGIFDYIDHWKMIANDSMLRKSYAVLKSIYRFRDFNLLEHNHKMYCGLYDEKLWTEKENTKYSSFQFVETKSMRKWRKSCNKKYWLILAFIFSNRTVCVSSTGL